MAIRFDPTEQETIEQGRSGRVGGWLRELFRPEPADVRRRRIEAEAAAEVGRITAQPEHAASR